MLKGIDPLIGPELLYQIAKMGHGDFMVLCDRNYPAYDAGAPVVRLDGVDDTTAIKALLTLLPLDTFTEDPVRHMASVETDDLLEVHQDIYAAASQAEGREIKPAPVERFAFYEQAHKAKLVVATSETRPYGCFFLTKGVL